MKKIVNLILISILCLVATDMHAQSGDVFHNRRFSIGLEPLFLIDGGLGLDFEIRLKESRNWLNLRLAGYGLPDYDSDRTLYYYTENYTLSSGFDNFRSYSGFGVQASYKSFFFRDVFYWGGGLSYNYYDVSYYTETYRPFEEEGMTFYKYYQGEESQYFNKIYPFLSLGVRTPSRKRFFVEGYITTGYSHSFYNEQRDAYDRNIFSFGYRGVTMTFGGRLGWQF